MKKKSSIKMGKKLMNKGMIKNIMTSLPLLYIVFILMIAQVSYLIYKKDTQSIFIFGIIIIISYLIFQNMIFVLGISLIAINLLMYFKNSKYEGMTNSDMINCNDFKNNIYIKINIDPIEENIPKEAMTFFNKIKSKFVNSNVDSISDIDFYKFYMDSYKMLKDKKSIEWINEYIFDYKKIDTVKCSTNVNSKNNSSDIEDTPIPSIIKNNINSSDKSNKPTPSSYNNDKFENNIEENKNDPGNLSNIIDRLKENTPQLAESLKFLNSIDINQVNSLINNLNTLAGSFAKPKNQL